MFDNCFLVLYKHSGALYTNNHVSNQLYNLLADFLTRDVTINQ